MYYVVVNVLDSTEVQRWRSNDDDSTTQVGEGVNSGRFPPLATSSAKLVSQRKTRALL